MCFLVVSLSYLKGIEIKKKKYIQWYLLKYNCDDIYVGGGWIRDSGDGVMQRDWEIGFCIEYIVSENLQLRLRLVDREYLKDDIRGKDMLVYVMLGDQILVEGWWRLRN